MVAKLVAHEPKVELKTVSFSKLSLSSVELAFEAEVENPNSFELGLDRMNYDVLLHGKKIGSGVFQEKFRVAAKTKKTVTVPFSLDTFAALQVAQQYFAKASNLDLRVKGKMDFVTPVGEFSKEFDASKTLIKSK